MVAQGASANRASEGLHPLVAMEATANSQGQGLAASRVPTHRQHMHNQPMGDTGGMVKIPMLAVAVAEAMAAVTHPLPCLQPWKHARLPARAML